MELIKTLFNLILYTTTYYRRVIKLYLANASKSILHNFLNFNSAKKQINLMCFTELWLLERKHVPVTPLKTQSIFSPKCKFLDAILCNQENDIKIT